VVIPTFERAARLPGLVAALEAQTLPVEDFDVIIADDGSRDETSAVLADLAARTRLDLRVVRNPTNRGPGRARNLAWRSSAAPIIAFTDDDCMPTPGWLEAGLARFAEGSTGIVQGRTLPDPSVALGHWAVTQRLEKFSDRYETCNIFYRRSVLEEVGGFDEEIVFFGEDAVPGWKARRLGIVAEFAPDALVHHAVTHPGPRYFLRWAMQHGNWATLVRRFPEMRREVLWGGVFVKRSHAGLIVALVGLVAGIVWRPALVLCIPYLWHRRPRALSRDAMLDQLLAGWFDVAVLVGLAAGSVRERTIVL
jgi:glycosyltransferase involved in cell wall biosynthesis